MNTEEFFRILEGTGALVDVQHFPSGDARGYKVALVGDTDAQGDPVWFSGSTLAPDLSCPKVAERLAPATTSLVVPPETTAWRRLAEAPDGCPTTSPAVTTRPGKPPITVLSEALDALPMAAPALVVPTARAAIEARAMITARRSGVRSGVVKPDRTRRSAPERLLHRLSAAAVRAAPEGRPSEDLPRRCGYASVSVMRTAAVVGIRTSLVAAVVTASRTARATSRGRRPVTTASWI